MPKDPKTQARIDEVNELLEAFSKEYLTDELTSYVYALWGKLARKRSYNITGGKKEVWAAAVVWVIGWLNFLYDSKQDCYLSKDTISEYFGIKKATVSAKALEIRKTCKIHVGHEGLCSEDISDSFTYYSLPNGLIVSKGMLKKGSDPFSKP